MAGIRIQHPTARNCRFTVVEPSIPYDRPYHCTPPALGGCGSVHLFKTHHLNLDETGAAIVGDVLYQRIKGHLALNGFLESNVVAAPPAIGIALGPGGQAMVGSDLGNIPIMNGVSRG